MANNKQLKVENKPLNKLKSESKYYPTMDLINVLQEYSWTVSNSISKESITEKNIPHIEMIEYEQDVSMIWANVFYWLKVIAKNSPTNNPYESLYHAKKTGTTFIFPFFSEYNHNLTQNWEPSKGIMNFDVVSKLMNLVQAGVGALNLAPGTAINQPKVWSGTGAGSYEFTFNLFNTVKRDDVAKNKKLINRLIMSSLHDQQNAILASPPALFEITIPGIRYSPAAVISNLSITNTGQMNVILGDIVPDAYEIKIQITELIVESRQIYDAAIKDKRMSAINNENNAEQEQINNDLIAAQAEASGQTTDSTGRPIVPP